MKISSGLCVLFCLALAASIASSSAPNGCKISITLDTFMKNLGTKMGKDLTPFYQKLVQNWIESPDQLWDVTDAQYQQMGFPIGLIDAIKKELNRLCCALKCDHGGEPNDQCNACVNCLGGWTGPACNQWDPTKKDSSTLLKEIKSIANDAIAALQAQQAKHPLPTNIGVGVDITTGRPKLPVIKLTYENPSRSWKTFRLPEQATFDPLPTGIYNPSIKSYVFTTMGDYVKQLFSWDTNQDAAAGMFSHQQSLQDVYNQFFNGDFSLAVVQEYYPVYTLSLPIDSTTKVREYQLDPFAQRALDFLPPDYSSATNQALYQTFIEHWGTSYTVNSVDGGLVELQSFFQTRLVTDGRFTTDGIAAQATIDFQNRMGQSTGQTVDKGYSDSRRLGTLDCAGGNAAELCDAAKLKNWIPTIEGAATSIYYRLADFTELIKDPIKKTNIQNAIEAFIAVQAEKWKNFNTCPSCLWGTCVKPNQYCNCENPRITGRACDACVGGWSGTKCQTPVCSAGCKHGSCVAPNQCQCSGHFVGAACDTCAPGWSGTNCDKPVCSPGCQNGGQCVSPNTCKCNGKFTGPTCQSCIAGWAGSKCDVGQRCFECGGSGKTCQRTFGCSSQYDYSTCDACQGSGQVPSNTQRCFRCGGSGKVCMATFGCSSVTDYSTCPACQHKGYIPGEARKCPTCYGSGKVCNRTFGCSSTSDYSTCGTCRGNGYVL